MVYELQTIFQDKCDHDYDEYTLVLLFKQHLKNFLSKLFSFSFHSLFSSNLLGYLTLLCGDYIAR